MPLHKKKEKTGVNLLRKILGIFLVSAFALLLFFSLEGLAGGLFYHEGNYSQPLLPLDYSILGDKISSYLWTFRLFDLLMVLQIIFLIAICGHYLIKFNSIVTEPVTKRKEGLE
ncbi:MAG: hypothetical protein GF308_12990 [Candidatus Heimdallarchaeota archaeon]|nr:hypothetical protein [Candidatus Heimdallarchaeota archaeon]